MAKPEEQNLPADGQSCTLQTTAKSEILCGTSPYSAGTDKVRTQKRMYEQHVHYEKQNVYCLRKL